MNSQYILALIAAVVSLLCAGWNIYAVFRVSRLAEKAQYKAVVIEKKLAMYERLLASLAALMIEDSVGVEEPDFGEIKRKAEEFLAVVFQYSAIMPDRLISECYHHAFNLLDPEASSHYRLAGEPGIHAKLIGLIIDTARKEFTLEKLTDESRDLLSNPLNPSENPRPHEDRKGGRGKPNVQNGHGDGNLGGQ